ncbi:MAG: hypothetical protein ACE360_04055 [Hyphomicrobiales bacterium]
MSTDIAAAAERSITSQGELLTTLSLAVIGGLLAVILRVRIHNSSNPASVIDLRCVWVMWIAMGLAAVSIGLSYLVSGMLVQMSPQIFSAVFDSTKAFSSQDFGNAPVSTMMTLSFAQFVCFCLSVIAGTIFVFSNRK